MSEFAKEIENYFCKFTFGQFVTLILLELVTLFFVFYLGAHYGPDLIGGKRTEKVANDAPLVPDTPKVDYTYPQVLSDQKDRGVIRVKPSGMTAQEYESMRVVVPAPAPEAAPQPEPVAEKLPPPPPEPAKQQGKYTIQVGSYPTAEEAATAVDQWKGKGYDTLMTIGEIPNKGTWYRVRIGRFKDRDEANRFLQKLRQKEKADGLVVLSKS